VKVGAPLMLLNSISYLEDGCLVEYVNALYRGDRSNFAVTLIRVGNRSKMKMDDSFIYDFRDTGLVSE